jgi:hypothetical protein
MACALQAVSKNAYVLCGVESATGRLDGFSDFLKSAAFSVLPNNQTHLCSIRSFKGNVLGHCWISADGHTSGQQAVCLRASTPGGLVTTAIEPI